MKIHQDPIHRHPQALFRGWRGRQLFRSRQKAQRALLDFDQQVQRSSILHRLETPTQPTQRLGVD